MEHEGRKVDYVLSGIDGEGNMLFEHTLDAHQVVAILANALKKTTSIKALVEQSPQVTVAQPSPKRGRSAEVVQELPVESARSRGRKSVSEETMQKIRDMREGGMTITKIKDELGVGVGTVYKAIEGVLKKDPNGSLPKDDKRQGCMTASKYQQIKIAMHHQLPEGYIASNMGLDIKEVHKAVMSRTYEEYSQP